MKSRSLCSVLVLVLGVVAVFSNAARSAPPDTIRGYDIIEIGEGTNPRFSPDSKMIAFLNEGWLCVRSSDGTDLTNRITPLSALDFQWMNDSSLIYWNQEGYGTSRISRNVGIVTLAGEHKEAISEPEGTRFEPPIFLPDGTIGYYKHSLNGGSKSFVVLRQGSLPPDSALKQLIPRIKFETPHVMYGDIWLVSIDGSYKKWVTFNKRFDAPLEMSYDGKKILATKTPGKDPYLGGGPYLVDLQGHEIYIGDPDIPPPSEGSTGSVLRHLIYGSVGSFSKFSPDGSKVVYLYEAMDTGLEDIVASDLVIKNVKGTGRFQLETPDIMEIYPVWSADGKMIACQTYDLNKIYVFRLR